MNKVRHLVGSQCIPLLVAAAALLVLAVDGSWSPGSTDASSTAVRSQGVSGSPDRDANRLEDPGVAITSERASAATSSASSLSGSSTDATWRAVTTEEVGDPVTRIVVHLVDEDGAAIDGGWGSAQWRSPRTVASTSRSRALHHEFDRRPWVFELDADVRSVVIHGAAPDRRVARVELGALRFDDNGYRRAAGLVETVVRLELPARTSDGTLDRSILVTTPEVDGLPDGLLATGSYREDKKENDRGLPIDPTSGAIVVEAATIPALVALRITSDMTVPRFVGAVELDQVLASGAISLDRGSELELALDIGDDSARLREGTLYFELVETREVGEVTIRHVRDLVFDRDGIARLEGIPTGTPLVLDSGDADIEFRPRRLVLADAEGSPVRRAVGLDLGMPPVVLWGHWEQVVALAGDTGYVELRSADGTETPKRAVRTRSATWTVESEPGAPVQLTVRNDSGLATEPLALYTPNETPSTPIDLGGLAPVTRPGILAWHGVPSGARLSISVVDPSGRLRRLALPSDGRVPWSGEVESQLVPGTLVHVTLRPDEASLVRCSRAVPRSGRVPSFDFSGHDRRTVRLSVDGTPVASSGRLALVDTSTEPPTTHELHVVDGVVEAALIDEGSYLFVAELDAFGGLFAGALDVASTPTIVEVAHVSTDDAARAAAAALAGRSILLETVEGRPVPSAFRELNVTTREGAPFLWPRCTYTEQP